MADVGLQPLGERRGRSRTTRLKRGVERPYVCLGPKIGHGERKARPAAKADEETVDDPPWQAGRRPKRNHFVLMSALGEERAFNVRHERQAAGVADCLSARWSS